MKILTIVAMQDEAEPTIQNLGLAKVNSSGLPFIVYQGNKDGNEITLMVSGKNSFGVDNVATQTAAVMTALGIREFSPDLVCNIGTAGGFESAGSKIGDVYLVSDFIYHDRRIPLGDFEDYGIGGYRVHEKIQSLSDLPRAICTTGNSLDSTEDERKKMRALASKGKPVVKEMEAAAIAEMCKMFQTPLVSIKSVTDIVDGHGVPAEEFMQNLGLASNNLQIAFKGFLEGIPNEIPKVVPWSVSQDVINNYRSQPKIPHEIKAISEADLPNSSKMR